MKLFTRCMLTVSIFTLLVSEGYSQQYCPDGTCPLPRRMVAPAAAPVRYMQEVQPVRSILAKVANRVVSAGCAGSTSIMSSCAGSVQTVQTSCAGAVQTVASCAGSTTVQTVQASCAGSVQTASCAGSRVLSRTKGPIRSILSRIRDRRSQTASCAGSVQATSCAGSVQIVPLDCINCTDQSTSAGVIQLTSAQVTTNTSVQTDSYSQALASAMFRARNRIHGHSYLDTHRTSGVGWASSNPNPNTCLGVGGSSYAVVQGSDGWYATKFR